MKIPNGLWDDVKNFKVCELINYDQIFINEETQKKLLRRLETQSTMTQWDDWN